MNIWIVSVIHRQRTHSVPFLWVGWVCVDSCMQEPLPTPNIRYRKVAKSCGPTTIHIKGVITLNMQSHHACLMFCCVYIVLLFTHVPVAFMNSNWHVNVIFSRYAPVHRSFSKAQSWHFYAQFNKEILDRVYLGTSVFIVHSRPSLNLIISQYAWTTYIHYLFACILYYAVIEV